MTSSIQDNETVLSDLRAELFIQGQVQSFDQLRLAQDVCYQRQPRPKRIVEGENGWYWVVSIADARRLSYAGYPTMKGTIELAPYKHA